MKRKLKGGPFESQPGIPNPQGLKLHLHHQRQLATMYQCLKGDDMIIDYESAAAELGCSVTEARSFYAGLTAKLRASSSAYEVGSRSKA